MLTTPDPAAATPVALDSVQDMILNGGPFMIPIALCSVVALAYVVERVIGLAERRLGPRRFESDLVSALDSGGAEGALRVCESGDTPLARILGAGLRRTALPTLEREKAVEDAGQREFKRLSAGLRPLVVVGMIAPLLGLLGTVWGMIGAFSSIALQDGLGRPELLAAGISQALITTAAGLCVAIPTQAAYYWLRSRIDRFARRTEDAYEALDARLAAEATA
jgi:biopolymer transport protein ExbB